MEARSASQMSSELNEEGIDLTSELLKSIYKDGKKQI